MVNEAPGMGREKFFPFPFCSPEENSHRGKSNIVPHASDKSRREQINLSYSLCGLLIVLSACCRYNVKFSFPPFKMGKSCG